MLLYAGVVENGGPSWPTLANKQYYSTVRQQGGGDGNRGTQKRDLRRPVPDTVKTGATFVTLPTLPRPHQLE